MKKSGITLYKIFQWLGFMIFAAMTIVVSWQVIARYLLHQPVDWSSELAKILMVWLTFIGIILAFYEHSHPSITFVVDKFPENTRNILDWAINIMLLFCFIVVTIKGIQLCMKTANKTTVVLKLPMYIEYASLPVSTAAMSFKILEDFAGGIIHKKKGERAYC